MVSENVTTLLLATETAKAVVAVNKILNWSLKLVPNCGPIKWSKKMVKKKWSKKIGQKKLVQIISPKKKVQIIHQKNWSENWPKNYLCLFFHLAVL